MNIKITGTGSFVPEGIVTNKDFEKNIFMDDLGANLDATNVKILEKFSAITGIIERRYADSTAVTSDLAYIAAMRAIENADVDKEQIDYIILAHNFGDVQDGKIQSDMVPCIASRVKHKLEIANPKCVSFDIIFGCAGWLEALIQAYAYIKAGMAKRCLVIGAECLSRVVDKHDRDSMIYADGAGATIVEGTSEEPGILAFESASYAGEEVKFLFMGSSYDSISDPDIRYIKMFGRKIYEFALTNVPKAMKSCVDKSGIPIELVDKVLIHQANEKMDEAIIKRFYKLYDREAPIDIMPMIIRKFGNSSVATVPTLYDMLLKGEVEGHKLVKGNIVLFASVGAGMNISAVLYKI